MPGTAISSRQNAWARIKHRYRKKSAAKLARRERQKLERARAMAQRRAMGSKR